MIGLTLKHLRYLDAIATHRHFSRAADACCISQPALSVQIKDLEARVGAPLVERSSRQMHMTSLGNELVKRARTILVQVDELENVIRSAKGKFTGRLRLGVIPTVAPYLLPSIAKALTSRFPELTLTPKEAVTQSLVEDLHDHKLDAAIVALPVSDAGLREFALFAEEFVLVRHLDDRDRPIPTPKAMREMQLLLLEEGHCFRDQALSFCDLSSARASEIMEGNSLNTLVQMVSAGVGLTLIPEMAIPLETRAADVAISRFKSEAPHRTIGMVWRKTNPLSEQLIDVGGTIRQAAQAHLQFHNGSS